MMSTDHPATPATDNLSPLAWEIWKLGAPAAYTRLVVTGPGSDEARAALENAAPENLLNRPISASADAQAVLAGLWLWHDWLAPCHSIVQKIDTPTGAFWHAIMHRREGDFDNSKYWYARCAGHPVIASIATHAADIINPLPADIALLRLMRSGWEPDVFVDLVKSLAEREGDPRRPAIVRLQQVEWRLLFDYCARQATL